MILITDTLLALFPNLSIYSDERNETNNPFVDETIPYRDDGVCDD